MQGPCTPSFSPFLAPLTDPLSSSDTDYIVALPTKTYANGAYCGKYVRVTRTSTGKSVVAMVADSVRLALSLPAPVTLADSSNVQCPTCYNNESIDMSYVAFTSIATEEEGMVRPCSLSLSLLAPSAGLLD